MKQIALLSGLLAALTFVPRVSAQPAGPQPWWPVQPRAMPFLHPLFTSDMVLQRDIAAPIWGWAKSGDKISIAVDGKPTALAVAGVRFSPNSEIEKGSQRGRGCGHGD